MNVSLTEQKPQNCAGSHFLSANPMDSLSSPRVSVDGSIPDTEPFVVLRAVQAEDSVLVGRDPVL